MDKKSLNDIMNVFKGMRIEIKYELQQIENLLRTYPALRNKNNIYGKKIYSFKKKYLYEYDKYGDCIDALMDMIDYQQGKHIEDKQIKRINKATSFGLFPAFIMVYIFEINTKYSTDPSFVDDFNIDNNLEMNIQKQKKKTFKLNDKK